MKCKLRERVLAVSTSIMLMLCIFISSGYTQTVNAEALSSIELEFGEGHEAAARKSKDVFDSEGYTSELEGTTLIVDWLPGASEKYTRDAITEIIRSALKNEKNECFDNNEKFGNYLLLKPVEDYSGYRELYDETESASSRTIPEEGLKLYVFWKKPITEAAYTVEVPICGTKVSYGDSKEGQPVITKDKNNHLVFYDNACTWVTNTTAEEIFLGEICGGETYVLFAAVDPDWGYYFTNPDNVATLPLVTINGERASWGSSNGFVFEMKAEHDWGEGTVTKEATNTEEGKRVYKCKHHETCGGIKEEVIPKKADEDVSAPSEMGTDGTAIGPGASVDATDKAITSLASDSDPAGAQFAPLKLKSTKQGNNNIKLSWAKVKGAAYYVVYGNACGKNNKLKRLANVKTNSYNVKKINKKLKKGKYHKFIVVAIDKNKRVISTSKIIHVATTGGKVGNHKSVTVKKAVITKAKKLKKGKTLKLAAVANKKKLKVNKHVAVRYESSNPKIATVTKRGVVKGKAKGTCYVYAYAQNGVCKRIKVTVS